MAEPQGRQLWQEQLAYIREDFISRLVGRGLTLIGDSSKGALSDARLQNSHVEVTLTRGFPYAPPEVRLTGEPRRASWHMESNGKLCLYNSEDRNHQPWRDVNSFLERIDAWFDNCDKGWPEDPPALDIETYLELPLDRRFLTYPGLQAVPDGYIRLKAGGNKIHFLGPGKVPKNTQRGLLSAYLTTLGELETPPRSWSDLVGRISERVVVLNALRRGRLDALLLRYSRQEQHGLLAIALNDLGKGPQPHRLLSASTDSSIMALRSGPRAEVLQSKNVCVVGGGALGSHVAEALVRAGLGNLTIRDFDILVPGNLTRHTIDDVELCGGYKADALKKDLERKPYCRGKIQSAPTALRDPAEAITLIEEFDLVVDATADGGVTLMLEDAAVATGKRIVTACLQNEGTTHRVDIVPPFGAAAPLPQTASRPPVGPLTFESGCGDPVSVSPPYAVSEAAAMATRHIIGLLTDNPVSANGEMRDFG